MFSIIAFTLLTCALLHGLWWFIGQAVDKVQEENRDDGFRYPIAKICMFGASASVFAGYLWIGYMVVRQW